MGLRELDEQRLNDLEELLKIAYKKLAFVEKKELTAYDHNQQFAIKNSLDNELIPTILRYEAQYTEILTPYLELASIPESDACDTLEQVCSLALRVENEQATRQNNDLAQLLIDIRQKLDDPGKAAGAKLKVLLPVIPLLVNYELEMDTEAFLVKTWQKINMSLKKFRK